MPNLFSNLKSILHLILVSKNVLLRKVFIFFNLLSLTFVSQVYINLRDWKSFQTPILKLLELFGRWKFDRLCILSYFLISEDILAVLPPLIQVFWHKLPFFSKTLFSIICVSGVIAIKFIKMHTLNERCYISALFAAFSWHFPWVLKK